MHSSSLMKETIYDYHEILYTLAQLHFHFRSFEIRFSYMLTTFYLRFRSGYVSSFNFYFFSF